MRISDWSSDMCSSDLNVPANARAFWAYVDQLCQDEDWGAASLLAQHHRRHFYFGKADGVKADYMHLRRCEANYNAGGGGKPSTVYDDIGAEPVAQASFTGQRLGSEGRRDGKGCGSRGRCTCSTYTQKKNEKK